MDKLSSKLEIKGWTVRLVLEKWIVKKKKGGVVEILRYYNAMVISLNREPTLAPTGLMAL